MAPFPLIVRPRGRGAVLGGHPWVMADSLILPAEPLPVGQLVELTDPQGKVLRRGLFNPHSRLAVRCYGDGPELNLDENFFRQRLELACDFRDGLLGQGQASRAGRRLVFSEGDQLSGLIVDRYADYLVVHQTAAVLTPVLPALLDHLAQRYQPRGMLHWIDPSTALLEGLTATRQWVAGTPPEQPIEIEENGLRWQIDLVAGQKTGYYLDQCDNRVAAARWIPANAHVLDVCTYLGGFALTIARHQPTAKVIAVDSSRRAIGLAQQHATLNGIDNVAFEVADFKDVLEEKLKAGEPFDAIVLDPPKLAGSRDSIERALRAYHRLNFQAVRLLRPGGILITCSCSGRVSREDFSNMLRGVSKQARRAIQILEQRGAAPDHPILATCPETDYLKCFIARVL